MAVYFTGTNTGKTYKDGQKFETSRGTVTAQKDGTFRNDATGQVSVGSSRDPNVKWAASGSDIARFTGGAAGEKAAQKAAQNGSRVVGETPTTVRSPSGVVPTGVSGGVRGLTSDAAAVRVMNPTAAQIWAGRAAFTRKASWSGKDDPGQDLMWSGFQWQAHPGWTNMELAEARYGDSELFQTLGFLATIGADIGWNARRAVWGENHQSVNVGNEVQKAVAAAVQPEAVAGTWNAWVSDVRGWAAENKAREESDAQIQFELDDAWDARLSYGKAEWDKIHTPINGPLYEERLAPNVWGY